MPEHQPNLLYIMTDQQTADAMSCAGDPHLHTPAMDRLAARGVRFTKAYCAQPLCVPARASMMTSLMPREVGLPKNLHGEIETAQRVPWLGRCVREAGYDTAYVGKWHLPVHPTRDAVHGFTSTRHAKGNGTDSYVAPSVREFFDQRSQDARDGEDDHDDDTQSGGKRQPFFVVASFVNPHDCCEAARGDGFPNGPIPESSPPPPDQCPPLPDNFAVPDHEPTAIRQTVQRSVWGNYPVLDWDEGRWRQYRWQYNRLVEMVDRQIGDVLDSLDEAGHTDDTVIVFTSDHGDGVGSHHWNQKQILYDESARVPFIVVDPRSTRKNETDEHLISSTLDLFPTLCDYAGTRPPSHVHGRSVRPLMTQAPNGEEAVHSPPWREAVICETEFGTFTQSLGVIGRMVRTRDYKYIVYARGTALAPELVEAQGVSNIRRGVTGLGEGGGEQLFDMTNDPGELNDLSIDPAYRHTLQLHRNHLIEWAKHTDDPFPVQSLM